MSLTSTGIHHVTAISGDAQRNLDFYLGVLGLRLVKRTVNFDDPATYHLYYGDEAGRPGTILTFFPWKGAPRGTLGAGQTCATAFAVPTGSLGFWHQRLSASGLSVEAPRWRFGEELVALADPDGLRLELVADPGVEDIPPWQESPVAERHAIRAFHGVTLLQTSLEPTAAFLTDSLGFAEAEIAGQRHRFLNRSGDLISRVDVVVRPGEGRGRVAIGSVHHVAFRVSGDQEQARWRSAALAQGLRVTPVQDRSYFRSIYFREPGGALFEVATDTPGFTIDESLSELGGSLRLPGWLEPRRSELTEQLPALALPEIGRRVS